MIVCICNALNDRAVHEAACDAHSVADVFRRCGRRPQCGKCLPDVAEIIHQRRSDRAPRLVAAE